MTTITIERGKVERWLSALEVATRFVYQDNRPECEAAVEDLRAALSAPERKPMTLDEIKSNPVISYFGVESGEKIVRAVEAFHGITKG